LRYTPKQIEQYRRRKYISVLEKMLKNLFRTFRSASPDPLELQERLQKCISQLNSMDDLRLDSEYLRESESYLRRLYSDLTSTGFGREELEEIREAEIGRLNRLQKLKNRSSYNRSRENRHAKEDEWGH
jgi:predicted ribosome quality control (RQC) complex YloA/Tae2 family protein